MATDVNLTAKRSESMRASKAQQMVSQHVGQPWWHSLEAADIWADNQREGWSEMLRPQGWDWVKGIVSHPGCWGRGYILWGHCKMKVVIFLVWEWLSQACLRRYPDFEILQLRVVWLFSMNRKTQVSWSINVALLLMRIIRRQLRTGLASFIFESFSSLQKSCNIWQLELITCSQV